MEASARATGRGAEDGKAEEFYMKKQHGAAPKSLWNRGLAAVLGLALAMTATHGLTAQQAPSPEGSSAAAGEAAPAGQTPAPPIKPGDGAGQKSAQNGPDSAQKSDNTKAEKHITPEQAKQLFALVDQLMQFSSEETGLAIKSTVKRQLTSRAEVESYLNEKFNEDESAKRLQRGEIVLKKFGMLDHDFDLKPFLLALLKEQIAAFYDSKTKTVNLLDWVSVDDQKPVLAHELTHALQDQRVNLEKWSDQTPDDVSTNYKDDIDHLAKDEMDTAREAVAEGQATAVMMDNVLKPMGKSLIKDPEVVDFMKEQMAASPDSPVMARAPLLLSESLLFPYREGLSFEQDVWMDKGQSAAFAGALDRPPSSTWEVINPREFEKGRVPVVPLMPDIHPVVDKTYRPYDIGQIGELDLHILSELFGGDAAARDLTPAWDGGIYWAGQRLSATTPAEQADTKSISLFYLSAWKNPAAATAFAQLYADSLGRKYSGLKRDVEAQKSTPADAPSGTVEQVFSTNEGPVTITTRGKLVFVAEGFDLPVARKLAQMMLDAQGTGDLKMAQSRHPQGLRPRMVPAASGLPTLSGGLVHLFADSGVMKCAVDAEIRATLMR
jgi:hypothetical protein